MCVDCWLVETEDWCDEDFKIPEAALAFCEALRRARPEIFEHDSSLIYSSGSFHLQLDDDNYDCDVDVEELGAPNPWWPEDDAHIRESTPEFYIAVNIWNSMSEHSRAIAAGLLNPYPPFKLYVTGSFDLDSYAEEDAELHVPLHIHPREYKLRLKALE